MTDRPYIRNTSYTIILCKCIQTNAPVVEDASSVWVGDSFVAVSAEDNDARMTVDENIVFDGHGPRLDLWTKL